MTRNLQQKSAFDIIMFVAGLVSIYNLGSWTGEKIVEWYMKATDAEAALLLKIYEAEAELAQLNEKLAELRAAREEVQAAEQELQAANDNPQKSRRFAPPLSIRF